MNLQRQSYFSVSSEGVPIRNTADYSPFGVQLDGRTIQEDFYRRGFNGMEKDDEVKGGGNSYTTEFRQYDARVGRWLSLDPLANMFVSFSPYNYVSDNPIINIDIKGDADIYFNGKWIGTDGVNDGLVAIASSREIANTVKSKTKEGLNYPSLGLSNGEKNSNFSALHIDLIKASSVVLNKAIKTKLTKAEHSSVLIKTEEGGFKTIEERSPPVNMEKTNDGTIASYGGENASGDILIHSHPIGLYDVPGENKVTAFDATEPSPYDEINKAGDKGAFKHYELNIIVGRLGLPTLNMEGKVVQPELGIVVFDSDSNEKMRMTNFDIDRIVKTKVKSNEKRKEKFNKKQSE